MNQTGSRGSPKLTRKSKSPPLSPRQLRRAKTWNELGIVGYKKELEKISSRSEKLNRKHKPDKQAEKLLDDLSRLPRARSESLAITYVHTLHTIQRNSTGHEARIQELEETKCPLVEIGPPPKLTQEQRDALRVARQSISVAELLEWPAQDWTPEVFRRLLFRKKAKMGRDVTLIAELMKDWMGSAGLNTEFREDGCAKALLIFVFDTLDNWSPDPEVPIQLFKQICDHFSVLPTLLLQIIERICEVCDILPEVIVKAINLAIMMPRALKNGFPLLQIKYAMRHFAAPSAQQRPVLHEIYTHIQPSYEETAEIFV